MQKSNILLAVVLFAGMILSGFQCSSTELTSARLYIQQKNFDKAIEVLKKDVEKKVVKKAPVKKAATKKEDKK